jgi:anti-anti-sigma factor
MSTDQICIHAAAPARAQPPLCVELVGCGSTTVIEVRGDVDVSTVHLLTDLVEQVAVHCPARLVLDLAKVTFFCAAGLRGLMHAREVVTAAGGRLLLRDPSPRTWRVLTLTRTEDLFPLDTPTAAGIPRGPAPSQPAAPLH